MGIEDEELLGCRRRQQRGAQPGWSHPNPAEGYETVSFAAYPDELDRCLLDDDVVIPQEGDFYRGWITVDMVGPFKGAATASGL